MKVISPNFKQATDPDKDQIITFLKKELKEKNISFDQLRARLQIKISDKHLHRICIDAGYGVIK